MKHGMALVSTWYHDCIRGICVVFVLTLLLIVSPIPVTFFALVYLYRWIVTFWKNKRLPQFGPLLDGLDSMLHFESPYFNELRLNIGYHLTVQGRIQLEDFRNVVQRGLENFWTCDESSRKLRQVITTLAGFSVGKDETNFQIQHHVRLLNAEELNGRLKWQCGIRDKNLTVKKKIHREHFTLDDLADLNGSLLRLPYKEGTSPWEILILFNPQPGPIQNAQSLNPKKSGYKNDQNVTSVVFIRMYHAIADAIALNCLVSQFLDQSPKDAYGRTCEFFSTNKSQTKVESASIKNVTDFVVGLSGFISDKLMCFHENWPSISLEQPSKYHRFSWEFPTQKLKIIKENANQCKLKSSTVFFGAITLAIRDYFRANSSRDKLTKFHKMPLNVHAPAIFADPRRRYQLTNKFLVAGIRLPFSDESHTDSRGFLHEIEKSYMHTKNSKILGVTRTLIFLGGILPFKLKLPFFVPWQGFGLSCVPSFEIPVTILGKPVVAAQAVTSSTASPCIMIFVYESHDTIHGSFSVAEEMLKSSRDAKAFATTFANKLNSIYREIVV